MRDAYTEFNENLSSLGVRIESEKGLVDYFDAAIVNARKDLLKAHDNGTLDDGEYKTLTERLSKIEIHITNPRYHLWVARGKHEFTFLLLFFDFWQAYYLAGDGGRGINFILISAMLLLISFLVNEYVCFPVFILLIIFNFLDLKRILDENEKIHERIIYDK